MESGLRAEFRTFYVNDLSTSQVESFIDTWYDAVERNAVVGRLEDESTAEARFRKRRVAARSESLKLALRENLGLRRLAANPMLLSIIALVHRSLAVLPKERSKLYSQCSKILLEQWDISRGVQVDDTQLKLGQKESIMKRLAYAFHAGEIGDSAGGREARRSDVERLIGTMLPAMGRTPDDAPRLLSILIERSGILTERQLDVLTFSHQTFQEYFTAQYLTEHHEHAESLLDDEHLYSDWWREVHSIVRWPYWR